MQPTLFPPSGRQVLTVSQLTAVVKEVLEQGFPSVWVEGEVSNFTRHSSGHWYFKLKDSEATLGAAMWRGVNLRVKFDLANGLRVIARGRLSVYAPRGDYSLIVEEIQPKGVGPLELAFRQLREKLERLGYFDPARKRPIPAVPRRVALITSATSSAVRDMLETLGRRWPAVEVWVVATRVQGEGAALEIEKSIALVNRLAGAGTARPVDVLIVGRGGGSLEDLWPFNEEPVARAIYQSRIPVVTGIGHEDDYTIADMVADLRALTPTDAACKVTPDRVALLQRLDRQREHLRDGLLRRLETAGRALRDLATRRCFRQPLARLRDEEQRLDECADRLARAGKQRLALARQRVETGAARLESLSPLRVLSRGYSLTRRAEDQTVVRAATQVAVGDRLLTVVERGTIVSRVEESRLPE